MLQHPAPQKIFADKYVEKDHEELKGHSDTCIYSLFVTHA